MENVKMNFEDKISLLRRLLTEQLGICEKVYIMPHKNMDFDAMASAAALYQICNSFNNETYIISDDNPTDMEASSSIMYKELRRRCKFIDTNKLEEIRVKDELLILVDTNKINLITIDNVDTYDNVIIIDHHKISENTVNTPHKFIDLDISSASEMAFNLIKKFNVNIDDYLAHCLLAGIYLDTNRLSRNFRSSTSRAVAELMELGANSDDVNNLFVIANFDSDRIQQNLINKLIDSTKFSMYNIAITMNEEDIDTVYSHESLSQAADYLLRYSIDAAFVIGFVDKKELGIGHEDIIAVKARSKNKKDNNNKQIDSVIDVSEIMRVFNGGGDNNRAACLIYSNDIYAVKEAINYLMTPGVTLMNDTKKSEKVLKFVRK